MEGDGEVDGEVEGSSAGVGGLFLAGHCAKSSLRRRRAMWNSSRVVRVCSMEFLLVVRVWIALWLKMMDCIVVVAAGKGVKRILMCPRSSGLVRRVRSSCLAGERGSVIFG